MTEQQNMTLPDATLAQYEAWTAENARCDTTAEDGGEHSFESGPYCGGCQMRVLDLAEVVPALIAALRASREQLAKVREWAIWRAAYEHADEYACRLCRTSWIVGREIEHHADGCPAAQPASKEREGG